MSIEVDKEVMICGAVCIPLWKGIYIQFGFKNSTFLLLLPRVWSVIPLPSCVLLAQISVYCAKASLHSLQILTTLLSIAGESTCFYLVTYLDKPTVAGCFWNPFHLSLLAWSLSVVGSVRREHFVAGLMTATCIDGVKKFPTLACWRDSLTSTLLTDQLKGDVTNSSKTQ